MQALSISLTARPYYGAQALLANVVPPHFRLRRAFRPGLG